MRLNRRSVLIATGLGGAAVVGTAAGVYEGLLPGRPYLQERLGLNGVDGQIPRDVRPGRVDEGSFRSTHRLGEDTRWWVARPPGRPRRLPVLIALHWFGTTAGGLRQDLGIDRFLARAVQQGTPPFAVAAVDGGTTYWHRQATGEDAGVMVTEEFVPLLDRAGYDTTRIGLIGWSMGGYGALRLAGLLGAGRVATVVAVSPALWLDPADASPHGFDSAADYQRATVFGRQDDLAGIAVRVDCGTGDPFYRATEEYLAGFDPAPTSTFAPGGHDSGYWRRVLPAELRFAGAALGRA